MTDDPAASAWSSCSGLCGLRDDPLLTLHAAQQALGTDAYRMMLAEAINDQDLAAIRLYLQQQPGYGRDDFQANDYDYGLAGASAVTKQLTGFKAAAICTATTPLRTPPPALPVQRR